MYTVYILRTDKNTLYTGQTKDIQNRLSKHKSGKGAKYLRRFSKLEIVYQEKCESLSLALKRESAIKKLKKIDKESLIHAHNL